MNKTARKDGRLGFIADLSFLLCTTWLVLWRTEVSGAPRGSLWVSWWPALALGGLVVVALSIGLTQRKPRGFLPYALRWGFLAVLLVLPAWLAISLADAGARSVTLRSAATEARRDAAQHLDAATQPEQRRVQERMVMAADDGLKLLDALDDAKARGVELPRVELASVLPAADLDQLDPEAVEALETVLGVADALDAGGELPGELSGIIHSLGLDNPRVQMALIGLVAALLAPALGLSAAFLSQVLQVLVIDGQLSLGGLARVGSAALGSMGPDGFDPDAFTQKFEEYGEIAGDIVTVFEAIEEHGGDEVRRSETFQSVKKVALEATGRPGAPKEACPESTIDAAREVSRGTEDLERRLRNACPDLTPPEIESIANRGAR